MSNKISIPNKRDAGIFCRNVIEKNSEKFSSFGRIKDAWIYFHQNYPNVNLTYDNFWSHHRKVIVNSTEEKSESLTESDDLLMPDFQLPIKEEVKITIYNPAIERINEEIFIPYPSGKFVDYVISEDVGSMPGTTVVVAGDPSVGKTTMSLDLMYSAKELFISKIKDKKAKEIAEEEFIYFSSEMKRTDLQREERKKPWMRSIRSILLNEYKKEEYKALITKVFTYGYRMLVVDSFANICERLVSFAGMNNSEAASFLLHLCEIANTGNTETGHATCIYMIQQVTKGGVFVGKNGLKHDTTAMWELKFDGQERYAVFTKNRMNGDSNFKPIYFSLNPEREVVWNQERWEEDRLKEEMMKKNVADMEASTKNFNDIFLKTGDRQSAAVAAGWIDEDDPAE